VIYQWGKGKVPCDYIFHEMLHVCFSTVHQPRKEAYDKEEQMIRYLCQKIYQCRPGQARM